MKTRGALLVMLLGVAPLVARAIPVQHVELDVTGDVDRPRLLELLGLTEGEEFSEAALERGLSRIAEGGARFRQVEGAFDQDTGTLRISLRTALRLAGIDLRFSGPGADFASQLHDDLRQASGLNPGDAVSVDMLSDVRERFQLRMTERGFLGSQIVLALEDRGSSVDRTLLASIETGERSHVTKLSLRGFSADDTETLLRLLVPRSQVGQIIDQLPLPKIPLGLPDGENARSVPAAGPVLVAVDFPLDWIALNEALNRWAQKEREKGFYDFRNTVQVLEGKNEVTVGVGLDRGPSYNIQIRGNVQFWERDLRQKLTDRSLRLGVPFNANDAENQLKRLYLAAGYKDVRVAPEFRDEEGVRKVVLRVEEGRRYLLGSLSFDSGASGDPQALAQVLAAWRRSFQSPFDKTPFDEKALQTQLPDLLRRIRSIGYLQARILELRPRFTEGTNFVPVEIAVQLGFRAHLRSVSVTGNFAIPDSELNSIIDLKAGMVANPDRIAETNRILLSRYQELGFLDARVEGDEGKILRLAGEGPDVDLELRVDAGAQTRAGLPVVVGNLKTKEKVVLRELDADTLGGGRLWTPSGQRMLEQRLLGLGVFGAAEVRPTGGRRLVKGKAKEGVVEVQEKDVRIAVSERPAGSVEFGPGFRSDRGTIGFAEVNYRNLGGWNRGILARAEVSRKIDNYQFPEQKYSFAYLEPYLANMRLRLRFGIDYQRLDQTVVQNAVAVKGFNSEETTFSFLLERQLSDQLKLTYNLYTLSLAGYTKILEQNSSLHDYQIASTGPTLSFDTRDSIFNPSTGWLSTSSLELSAPQLGSRTNAHYLLGQQVLTRYFGLGERRSIAILGSYARIHGLGTTTNLPEGKRLALGGSSSLRSFSQNVLNFGQTGVLDEQSFQLKIEYRQPLLLDAGLAFFFDGGQIDVLQQADSSTAPLGGTGFRKALGFGLRYTTPVGPVSLDFAYNVDRRAGEPNDYKIQFSIGSF